MKGIVITGAVTAAVLLSLAPLAVFACTPNYVPVLQCDWSPLMEFVPFLGWIDIGFYICFFIWTDINNCPPPSTEYALIPLLPRGL